MPFKGVHPDVEPEIIGEILDQIIEDGGPVRGRYYNRMTPLHYAAHLALITGVERIKPVIDKLVDLGADINAKDRDGNMPIDLVGDTETIAALMPIFGPICRDGYDSHTARVT